jgi:hypothetical protein
MSKVSAQDTKAVEMGLIYLGGISAKGEPDPNSISYIEGTSMLSASAGLYSFVRIKKREKKGIIDYLKFDLHLAYRGGYFEIDGNQVMISGNYLDVDAIVPLRYNLSEKVDGYI